MIMYLLKCVGLFILSAVCVCLVGLLIWEVLPIIGIMLLVYLAFKMGVKDDAKKAYDTFASSIPATPSSATVPPEGPATAEEVKA